MAHCVHTPNVGDIGSVIVFPLHSQMSSFGFHFGLYLFGLAETERESESKRECVCVCEREKGQMVF